MAGLLERALDSTMGEDIIFCGQPRIELEAESHPDPNIIPYGRHVVIPFVYLRETQSIFPRTRQRRPALSIDR